MTNDREADEMDSFIPVRVQVIKKSVAEKQPSAQSKDCCMASTGFYSNQ